MNTETKVVSSTALLAVAAAAGSTSPALAADLTPVRAAAAPTSWEGLYLGGSLGASWLHSTHDETGFDFTGAYGAFGSRSTANNVGWLGGLQAGYNWQSRNFVFGVEGDITWLNGTSTTSNAGAGLTQTISGGYYGAYSVTTTSRTQRSSKIDMLSTFRARFGFDMNGTMPYITGGIAFGQIENKFAVQTSGYLGSSSFATSEKSWKTGLALGGGLEHKFDRNWSLRGEMLWVKFQDSHLSAPGLYNGTQIDAIKFSNSLMLGKIGLNYRF